MAELRPVSAEDITLTTTSEPVFLRSQPLEVLKVVLLGVGVGLLTAFLGWLLDRYVLQAIFCSGDSSSICTNGGMTAYYGAAVVTGLAATVILANWQIFRPLLIVVSSLIVLWGFKKYAAHLAIESPVEYYVYSGLLFGLCYLLFYWLLRLHNFIVSLIFVVVAIIGVRLFLTS